MVDYATRYPEAVALPGIETDRVAEGGDVQSGRHSRCDVDGLWKSRKENPQKPTQLSSRSHPRHLVGKRTAQKTPS